MDQEVARAGRHPHRDALAVAAYRTQALVLRKTKLGETDTIVTLLADDGRQIRAVAKGLRKPGGRFGARLEPYAVVDLLLHAGRSLDVVTEAVTVSSHAALREDYDRAAAAAVISDMLDKISVEGQPMPPMSVSGKTGIQTAGMTLRPDSVVVRAARFWMTLPFASSS